MPRQHRSWRERRSPPPPQAPNELTRGNQPPPPNPFGTLYNDPYTAQFEQVAGRTMADLSQPFSDPTLDDAMVMIRSRATGGSNPYVSEFANQARARIAELNQEPFSASEEMRMRTRVEDDAGRRNALAKRDALLDASRRGIADSSGVIQERHAQIDRGTSADLTRADSDLSMFITNERQRRRSEATGLGQNLASLGLQESAQADGRILQAATMLASIAAQKRGETRARQNDVLQIAQYLSNLGPQRLALAMNVLNGTGGNDLGGLFTNTLNLSNSQAQQQQYASQGNAAYMQGLGQILAILANQNRG